MKDTLSELGRINAMFPHLKSKDIAKIADLIAQREKEIAISTLDLIADGEGWEESREHYRKIIEAKLS